MILKTIFLKTYLSLLPFLEVRGPKFEKKWKLTSILYENRYNWSSIMMWQLLGYSKDHMFTTLSEKLNTHTHTLYLSLSFKNQSRRLHSLIWHTSFPSSYMQIVKNRCIWRHVYPMPTFSIFATKLKGNISIALVNKVEFLHI